LADHDTTKALRIAKVIEILNKKSPYGGATLKELADSCDVTTRSILRYLEQIENDMNTAIVRPERNTSKVEGQYRLDVGYLPSISPEKALVILLSLMQQKGSALAGHTNELKDALIGTLFKYKYNPKTLPVEQLQERIHIVDEQLADPARVSDIFTKLVQSLRDCCRVKIWYYVAHSRQNTERVVEPYGLICKRHNWYLIAYCLNRKSIRIFRVDQVTDIFPYTSERFGYPADFSLREHMAQSWGIINDGEICKVRLKFRPEVAHRVKRLIYHPSQSIEGEPADGSVIMSFEICGIDEMKTWIVQWGDTVEVLEPGWLREDICGMARSLLEVYKV
jgi:predicted DNA-binding transcriptional regulator YafY